MSWGEPYGSPYLDAAGSLYFMRRRAQRVRWYGEDGAQVGPEQRNVALAVAWAIARGWMRTEATGRAMRRER